MKHIKILESLDIVLTASSGGQSLFVIYDGSVKKSQARKICNEAIAAANLTPFTIHLYTEKTAPTWVKKAKPLYKEVLTY